MLSQPHLPLEWYRHHKVTHHAALSFFQCVLLLLEDFFKFISNAVSTWNVNCETVNKQRLKDLFP